MTAVNIPVTESLGRAVERVEVPEPTGFYGTLSTKDDTPVRAVERWRDRVYARMDALERQVQAKDGALTVIKRMAKGEGLPFTAENVLALAEEGLAGQDDAARLALASLAAGLATAEVEDYVGAVE